MSDSDDSTPKVIAYATVFVIVILGLMTIGRFTSTVAEQGQYGSIFLSPASYSIHGMRVFLPVLLILSSINLFTLVVRTAYTDKLDKDDERKKDNLPRDLIQWVATRIFSDRVYNGEIVRIVQLITYFVTLILMSSIVYQCGSVDNPCVTEAIEDPFSNARKGVRTLAREAQAKGFLPKSREDELNVGKLTDKQFADRFRDQIQKEMMQKAKSTPSLRQRADERQAARDRLRRLEREIEQQASAEAAARSKELSKMYKRDFEDRRAQDKILNLRKLEEMEREEIIRNRLKRGEASKFLTNQKKNFQRSRISKWAKTVPRDADKITGLRRQYQAQEAARKNQTEESGDFFSLAPSFAGQELEE